jgi:hypothetical protein
MQILSAQHLAELLMGIARAQAAIVQAVESGSAGFRSTHALPALQNLAHLRDHPEPTLVDLPVRILLASLGRAGQGALNRLRSPEAREGTRACASRGARRRLPSPRGR